MQRQRCFQAKISLQLELPLPRYASGGICGRRLVIFIGGQARVRSVMTPFAARCMQLRTIVWEMHTRERPKRIRNSIKHARLATMRDNAARTSASHLCRALEKATRTAVRGCALGSCPLETHRSLSIPHLSLSDRTSPQQRQQICGHVFLSGIFSPEPSVADDGWLALLMLICLNRRMRQVRLSSCDRSK
jgi:hypothetical protein